MGGRTFIAARSACLAASLVFVPILLSATVSLASETRLAFLSNSEKEQAPAIVDVPTLPAPLETGPYDGRWIFTGAGCRGAGSVSAVIRGGKVIVRGGGGNVTPDGIIHTVGAGNGMTLTAEGRLSRDSGSGTYDRSDGCSGTWIGVKQRQRR
jgi:hypothetical protein